MLDDATQTLDELVERMADRDEDALKQLYDLTVARIYSVAVRILHNEADAEEATLETFQQAWERACDFSKQRGSVLSWLMVIAWTRSVDRRRRLRVRGQHLQDRLRPDTGEAAYTGMRDGDSDRMLDALNANTVVHSALASLPMAQRHTIAMAFLEGMSHVEISESAGMPLGTVKSHIRRGLAALRLALTTAGVTDV